MNRYFFFIFFSLAVLAPLHAGEITMKISKRYLNLPVSQQVERSAMIFIINKKLERTFEIRLSANPEYWVFCDVTAFKGQTVTIQYNGVQEGLNEIHQSDSIEGQATLYKEANRPLYHFTTRRGWNNDPNDLVFYDMNHNRVNNVFYSPEDMTSMEITADIFIDKTSIEVFIDNGAYSYSMERRSHANNTDGFRFWGHNIEVKNLEVNPLKSIW